MLENHKRPDENTHCRRTLPRFPAAAATPRARFPPRSGLRPEEREQGPAAHLSHCLQKWRVPCLGMPSVMSTCARRHPTHMLAGLGGMGTPHWQQRLEHREEKSVTNNNSALRGDSYGNPRKEPKVHVLFFFFFLRKVAAQESRHPPRFMAAQVPPPHGNGAPLALRPTPGRQSPATPEPGRRYRLHVALGGGRRPRHVLHGCGDPRGPGFRA